MRVRESAGEEKTRRRTMIVTTTSISIREKARDECVRVEEDDGVIMTAVGEKS
jgi:hypothetical protein